MFVQHNSHMYKCFGFEPKVDESKGTWAMGESKNLYSLISHKVLLFSYLKTHEPWYWQNYLNRVLTADSGGTILCFIQKVKSTTWV